MGSHDAIARWQERVLPRRRPNPKQLELDFGPRPPEPPRNSVPATGHAHAELLLFPLAVRRSLIVKLAAQVAGARTGGAGENLLRGRLARLGRSLRRKRISEQVIASELETLESAVRGELGISHGGAHG